MLTELLRRIFKNQDSGLIPEKYYVVSIGSEVIECKDPKGKIAKISISNIEKVTVFTNDTGPWGIDFWWVLEGDREYVAIPQGATGEDELIRFVQNSPNFDDDNLIKANTCTGNAQFACWKKIVKNGVG